MQAYAFSGHNGKVVVHAKTEERARYLAMVELWDKIGLGGKIPSERGQGLDLLMVAPTDELEERTEYTDEVQKRLWLRR